jgi:serine/threonine protein kinase
MQPLADTGRVIAGRYRLQAPIGRGAMGVVWRARDQLLDRDVAVKEVQIADTLTEEERATAYQRTLREAKTAARLNHPAVVTVYDVAEDGGRPWIVMQLVRAQSLDQVLATSGPLSPRRAAEMARQLLSALSVAHAAGVMHRDVKPSNVLIGNDDRAVLTDFGIATFQGDPKLTQTGMVMGSPGFTAPERIRGEDASPASDLWSLGATIYAAIEGHGPFEKRGGAITTMSAIINEDAPEAPTAGALAPVIAALLRREPADRPDASAAARMIGDVLPQLPDRPPGAPPGYEATALSASSHPASPGSVRPRTPLPGETAVDYDAPAGQTMSKEPFGSPAAHTGPAAGGEASPAQTAPTTPQPVMGDAPSSGSSPGSWWQGSGSAARPEGAQAPDFSSWYDPSPRSGPAAQAGSGSAYPAPQGYGAAAAWSGAAAPPSPGAPSWSGAGYAQAPPQGPRRPPRSGLRWKAAIAVLAIIGAGAGAATVVLLHQNHSGSPHGGPSASGSVSAPATSPGGQPATTPAGALPPATLQIINAVNMPATGPLPSGWTTVSQPSAANETAGFSIAAPTDWKETTSGFQTYLRDPADPNINILIDLTPHTYPNNMVQEARYIETQSIPHFPGYHRVGLQATTIRNTPGAYWKFTWNNQGVQQEAIDLLFVLQTSTGPQSYAVYMTAPTSQFDQERPIFDEQVETFRPMPG